MSEPIVPAASSDVINPVESVTPMEPPAIDEPTESPFAPARYPVRIGQFLTGVILPVICFANGYWESPGWQSGMKAKAIILLRHVAPVPLYPFLLYCMTCMTLLFVHPKRFQANAWLRFGVYSGVLIAAEYCVIFAVALGGPDVIWAGLLQTLIALLIGGSWLIMSSFLQKYFKWLYWGVVALLSFLALLNPPAAFILCLLFSTSLAIASYFVASILLIRTAEDRLRFSLAQLLGLVTWFAAHCSAWRLSYMLMLEEFSQLPKTQPHGCFVCTAAAQGHPYIVHCQEYCAPNGNTYRVSHQLRILKAFELLLLSVSPTAHRACRWLYNRVGPQLAAMIVHPLLADVAYFSLKPIEWLAICCLWLTIPGKLSLVYRLYKNY